MIPQLQQKAQKSPWQTALQASFTDALALLTFLEIDPSTVPWITNQFPLKVPYGFAKKMKKGDPHDPLLKQILPTVSENIHSTDFSSDPLAEQTQNPLPGLIHKFKSRVLVMPATRCPIHCRYCFRRHFPYDENNINLKSFDKIANYIEEDSEIHEVIFSGGDPLYAPDHYLKTIINKLTHIPHLKLLRFHTRFPITLPERIDNNFIQMLNSVPFQIVIITHCNHPQELCDNVKEAVSKLKAIGVTVLNQGVILKDVNDNADTLIALSYRLFECGILPYYMNKLDKVTGAEHFNVSNTTLKTLYQALLANLPGYLVPRFVEERPFQSSKHPLMI